MYDEDYICDYDETAPGSHEPADVLDDAIREVKLCLKNDMVRTVSRRYIEDHGGGGERFHQVAR